MKELFIVKRVHNFVSRDFINSTMKDSGNTEFNIADFDINFAILHAVNGMEVIGVCTSLSKAKSIVKKIDNTPGAEFFNDGDVVHYSTVDIDFDSDDVEDDMDIIMYDIVRIKPDKLFDDNTAFMVNVESFMDNCDAFDMLLSDMMEIEDNGNNSENESKED